ncbi:MAG: tetratricopeptide repeat protein [bacterium]|nr:tetratricopeptide repeat protein [bacterium]
MVPGADIEDRIEKCQKILEGDPNSQIFAALAEALRRKGDLDRAFRVCQSGLRLHPNYGSAHIVMAKINLDRGLYDWAEAEVKRAIEIEGNSRTIELLLAEIYIYKGEFVHAVKLLRKLHLADPGNDQIKRLLDIAQRLPEEQAAQIEPRSLRGGRIEIRSHHTELPVAKAPVADAQPVAVAPRTKLSSRDLLEQVVVLPGIDGALFVNQEGLVVESEWGTRLDASTCAAAMSEAIKLANHELTRTAFGQASSVLIEAANAVFFVVRVPEGLFVFYGNGTTNLGTLRMKIASLLEMYGVR